MLSASIWGRVRGKNLTVDEDSCGGQFGRKVHDAHIPIVPAKNTTKVVNTLLPHNKDVISLPHGKSKRRVNESSGERYLATRYGKERDKFAQAQHDRDTGGGYDGVTE